MTIDEINDPKKPTCAIKNHHEKAKIEPLGDWSC